MASFVDRIRGLLTRETSGGRFIPEIDGLRFFAIAAVLLYHINGYVLAKTTGAFQTWVPGWWGHLGGGGPSVSPTVAKNPASMELARDALSRVCAEGYFGVQLFFAISGFILALPFASRWLDGGKPVSLGKYYQRRVLRLEPPYIVNLVLCTVLAVFVWKMPPADAIRHLGASAIYSHYGGSSLINTVAWSLEIEVQFYILAPILSLVFAIQGRTWRRAILVLAMLGAGLGQRFFDASDHSPTSGPTILNQLHWFLVGFLLADLYLTEWREREPASPIAWDVAASLAWVGLWWCLYSRTQIHLVAPFLMLIAYAGAFRGKLWRWFVRLTPVYVIGGMCYTVYLYHFLLISLFGKWTTTVVVSDVFAVQLLFHIFALSVPVLAVCAVLFALFEKPFMLRDWPRRAMGWLRSRGTGIAPTT